MVQPPVVRDSNQRPIVGVHTGVYIYNPHSVHAHEGPIHPSGRSLPRIFGPATSPPVKEQSCSIPSGTDPIPSIFKVPTDKVKMCSRP